MSDQPAAIRGCFSDFRLIKGRKVAQLVIELPIEEADAALVTLGGLPQPAAERWVAVARLNGSVGGPESKEKRRFEDLKAAMQAGIRCSEPAFQKFLGCENEEHAATKVRLHCRIASRASLNTDTQAARIWRNLESRYQAWLKAPA